MEWLPIVDSNSKGRVDCGVEKSWDVEEACLRPVRAKYTNSIKHQRLVTKGTTHISLRHTNQEIQRRIIEQTSRGKKEKSHRHFICRGRCSGVTGGGQVGKHAHIPNPVMNKST